MTNDPPNTQAVHPSPHPATQNYHGAIEQGAIATQPRDPRCPPEIINAVNKPVWHWDENGACVCRSPKCNARAPGKGGKHPRFFGGTLGPPWGYTVQTGRSPRGSDVVVIDLDYKPAQSIDGIASWHRLLTEHHGSIPDTLIVSTPSGGQHWYFSHPVGIDIVTTTNILCDLLRVPTSGIDVRGFGGLVIGPGSPSPVGARMYAVLHAAPLAPMPGFLIGPLTRARGPRVALSGGDASDAMTWSPLDPNDGAEGQAAAIRYALDLRDRAEPAIEGRAGEGRLMSAVRLGIITYRLPPAFVRACLATYYNPRCVPPFEDREIDRKISEVIETNAAATFVAGPMPTGMASAAATAALVGYQPSKPRIERRRADDGSAHDYDYDAGLAQSPGVGEQAPYSAISTCFRTDAKWAGVFSFDDLARNVIATRPPLRLECEDTGKGLTDNDVTDLLEWLEFTKGIRSNRTDLRAAVVAVSNKLRFNPIVDYLESCRERHPNPSRDLLDTYASAHFDAEHAIENRVTKGFLVAAVARALRPGTQVDTVFVLQGEQGMKKSTFFRAMFSPWYRPSLPDFRQAEEVAMAIASSWCAELGELDRLLRAEDRTVKNIISMASDYYRPKYERTYIDQPRRCVLAGSTNEPAFLRDPTGWRRYHVVRVRRPIDLAAVTAHRDEVFAAAWEALRDGWQFWIDEGSEEAHQLAQVNSQFSVIDPWHGAIEAYLAGRSFVTLEGVYRDGICMGDQSARRSLDWRTGHRIAAVLTSVGCRAGRGAPYHGRRPRGFVVPASFADRPKIVADLGAPVGIPSIGSSSP